MSTRPDLRRYAARLPAVPAGVALALLAACAAGPDFQKPAAPTVDGYTRGPLPDKTAATDTPAGTSQRFVRGMDIPAQWWTLFQSQPLDALMDAALKANPDLQAQQAALRAARESVSAQVGAYYPSVDAELAPSRQKVPNDLASPASSGATYVTLYSASVNVSYSLDIFGLNRRQVESLQAQADAQRFQFEATYLALTSNVAGAAILEASLRGQVAATQEIVADERQMLDMLKREKELGMAADLDVAAQETALTQAEAALPPLQKQLEQQRDLLATLTGRFPSEAPAARFELADLLLPRDIPVSLPAQLVEQRPDVRAAEENLRAANAQVGEAVANRLPNITLSASDGSTSLKPNQLFTAGTGIWSAMLDITQPIFEGGRLLHEQRAAEAAYDQAAAQYRSTVLNAFQSVADTLYALQADADALKSAEEAEQAAARSLKIARRQLELGDVSRLALLNVEQSYLQAKIALVQAQAARFADTVALFQALGGGWWNRAAAEDVGGTRAPSAGNSGRP